MKGIIVIRPEDSWNAGNSKQC